MAPLPDPSRIYYPAHLLTAGNAVYALGTLGWCTYIQDDDYRIPGTCDVEYTGHTWRTLDSGKSAERSLFLLLHHH